MVYGFSYRRNEIYSENRGSVIDSFEEAEERLKEYAKSDLREEGFANGRVYEIAEGKKVREVDYIIICKKGVAELVPKDKIFY